MADLSYTKGEWKAQKYTIREGVDIEVDTRLIATCYAKYIGLSEEEAKANARLIAVAVAVAEALSDIYEAIKAWSESCRVARNSCHGG